MRFACWVIIICALGTPLFGAAEAPPFREIYDLLRTNLGGVSETQLDRAAAVGLIDQLKPKVMLVDGKEQAATNATLSAKASVFDSSYGYVRVNQLGEGT